jgi:heme a synthase
MAIAKNITWLVQLSQKADRASQAGAGFSLPLKRGGLGRGSQAVGTALVERPQTPSPTLPLSGGGRSAAAEPSRAAVRLVRLTFAVLSVLGLAALIFGIENRLTPTGVFLFAPPVDLVPPLTSQAWFGAFAVHQQDPVFIACGATESLAQFKALYWWEWLRRGSLILVAGVAVVGLAAASLWFRFALRRFAGLGLIVLGYFVANALFDLAASHETLIRYNVGQYRHALDLTFACIAVAACFASAMAPPGSPAYAPARAFAVVAWAGIVLVVAAVATGALFAARDAAAVWPGFPWYETGLLPPLDRFTGYAPLWLNLTFNQYTIQLLHRLAAVVLWVALLGAAISMWRRKAPAFKTVGILFVVVTAEMAAGIATLVLGVPAVPSVVHEVGAVFVLAGVFFLLLAGWAFRPIPMLGR